MTTDDHGCIEIALVVSVMGLRRILKSLCVNGRHWWIATDVEDVHEIGWITVGWGDQLCSDPLNTLYFRLPVLDSGLERTADSVLLLFDASSVVSEERGDAGFSVADFEEFFYPLKAALVAQFQANAY